MHTRHFRVYRDEAGNAAMNALKKESNPSTQLAEVIKQAADRPQLNIKAIFVDGVKRWIVEQIMGDGTRTVLGSYHTRERAKTHAESIARRTGADISLIGAHWSR